MASVVLPLAQLGFGAFSNIFRNRPYKWWQSAISHGKERAEAESRIARERALSIFDPLREGLLGDFDFSQNLYRDLLSRYLAESFGSGIYSPETARQNILNYLNYRPEGFSTAYAGLGDLIGQLDPLAAAAQAGFLTGGWTPQYQDLEDLYRREMLGLGAENAALSDAGLDILGRRGQSAETIGLRERMMDAVNSGGLGPELRTAIAGATGLIGAEGWNDRLGNIYDTGMNLVAARGMSPEIGALYGLGQGLAQTRGMSPEISAALGSMQDILAQGGRTPEASGLYDLGQNIALRREAEVMSPEQAAQLAREQAHAERYKQQEKALRQAQARGGGAVVSGLQGRGLAEFSDAAAAAADEEARKALLSQQALSADLSKLGVNAMSAAIENIARNLGLGLSGTAELLRAAAQREGLGYNAMSEALQRALSREGLGFDAAGRAAQLAAGREELGYRTIPAAVSTGTAHMDALLRGGLNAIGHELDALRLGGALLGQYNQGRLAGASGLGSLMNQRQNYALNLGQFGANLRNMQGGFYKDLASLGLQGSQFGLNLGQALNADIRATNPFATGFNAAGNLYSGATGGLINLYNPWMNAYNTYSRDSWNYDLPSGIRPTSPLEGMGGAFGDAAQAVLARAGQQAGGQTKR